MSLYFLQQKLPDARLIPFPDSGHGSLFQFSEEIAPDGGLLEAIKVDDTAMSNHHFIQNI